MYSTTSKSHTNPASCMYVDSMKFEATTDIPGLLSRQEDSATNNTKFSFDKPFSNSFQNQSLSVISSTQTSSSLQKHRRLLIRNTPSSLCSSPKFGSSSSHCSPMSVPPGSLFPETPEEFSVPAEAVFPQSPKSLSHTVTASFPNYLWLHNQASFSSTNNSLFIQSPDSLYAQSPNSLHIQSPNSAQPQSSNSLYSPSSNVFTPESHNSMQSKSFNSFHFQSPNSYHNQSPNTIHPQSPNSFHPECPKTFQLLSPKPYCKSPKVQYQKSSEYYATDCQETVHRCTEVKTERTAQEAAAPVERRNAASMGERFHWLLYRGCQALFLLGLLTGLSLLASAAIFHRNHEHHIQVLVYIGALLAIVSSLLLVIFCAARKTNLKKIQERQHQTDHHWYLTNTNPLPIDNCRNPHQDCHKVSKKCQQSTEKGQLSPEASQQLSHVNAISQNDKEPQPSGQHFHHYPGVPDSRVPEQQQACSAIKDLQCKAQHQSHCDACNCMAQQSQKQVSMIKFSTGMQEQPVRQHCLQCSQACYNRHAAVMHTHPSMNHKKIVCSDRQLTMPVDQSACNFLSPHHGPLIRSGSAPQPQNLATQRKMSLSDHALEMQNCSSASKLGYFSEDMPALTQGKRSPYQNVFVPANSLASFYLSVPSNNPNSPPQSYSSAPSHSSYPSSVDGRPQVFCNSRDGFNQNNYLGKAVKDSPLSTTISNVKNCSQPYARSDSCCMQQKEIHASRNNSCNSPYFSTTPFPSRCRSRSGELDNSHSDKIAESPLPEVKGGSVKLLRKHDQYHDQLCQNFSLPTEQNCSSSTASIKEAYIVRCSDKFGNMSKEFSG